MKFTNRKLWALSNISHLLQCVIRLIRHYNVRHHQLHGPPGDFHFRKQGDTSTSPLLPFQKKQLCTHLSSLQVTPPCGLVKMKQLFPTTREHREASTLRTSGLRAWSFLNFETQTTRLSSCKSCTAGIVPDRNRALSTVNSSAKRIWQKFFLLLRMAVMSPHCPNTSMMSCSVAFSGRPPTNTVLHPGGRSRVAGGGRSVQEMRNRVKRRIQGRAATFSNDDSDVAQPPAKTRRSEWMIIFWTRCWKQCRTIVCPMARERRFWWNAALNGSGRPQVCPGFPVFCFHRNGGKKCMWASLWSQ